jgi:hypothetical protein
MNYTLKKQKATRHILRLFEEKNVFLMENIHAFQNTLGIGFMVFHTYISSRFWIESIIDRTIVKLIQNSFLFKSPYNENSYGIRVEKVKICNRDIRCFGVPYKEDTYLIYFIYLYDPVFDCYDFIETFYDIVK